MRLTPCDPRAPGETTFHFDRANRANKCTFESATLPTRGAPSHVRFEPPFQACDWAAVHESPTGHVHRACMVTSSRQDSVAMLVMVYAQREGHWECIVAMARRVDHWDDIATPLQHGHMTRRVDHWDDIATTLQHGHITYINALPLLYRGLVRIPLPWVWSTRVDMYASTQREWPPI